MFDEVCNIYDHIDNIFAAKSFFKPKYLKNVKRPFIQTEHFDAFYINVKNDQMTVQRAYQRAFINHKND